MIGLKIICACCGRYFEMCKACYSGHVYCGEECRASGYREKNRLRKKKYRKTSAGRKKHRKNEKKRRLRRKQGIKPKPTPNKIVKSCICFMMQLKSLFTSVDPSTEKGKCFECGCEIDRIIDSADMGVKKRTFDPKRYPKPPGRTGVPDSSGLKPILFTKFNFLPL